MRGEGRARISRASPCAGGRPDPRDLANAPPPLSETGDTEDSAILRGEGTDGFGAPGAREGVEQKERGAEAILASPQDLPGSRVGPTFDAQCAVRAGNQAAPSDVFLNGRGSPEGNRRSGGRSGAQLTSQILPRQFRVCRRAPILRNRRLCPWRAAQSSAQAVMGTSKVPAGSRTTRRTRRTPCTANEKRPDTSVATAPGGVAPLIRPPREVPRGPAGHVRQARPASERAEWGRATDPPRRSSPCGAFISRCAYSSAFMRIGQLG